MAKRRNTTGTSSSSFRLSKKDEAAAAVGATIDGGIGAALQNGVAPIVDTEVARLASLGVEVTPPTLPWRPEEEAEDRTRCAVGVVREEAGTVIDATFSGSARERNSSATSKDEPDFEGGLILKSQREVMR